MNKHPRGAEGSARHG